MIFLTLSRKETHAVCLTGKQNHEMKNSPRKRLFLIDGSAVAYRSYFAFIRNPLINSKGENIGAVFGFIKTLLKIMDEEKPDYFAVIFDRPEPTFRHKLFDEYKAQRPRMADDMVSQLPRIEQMMTAMNIPLISKAGFEADDIMGTLAKRATSLGIDTVLVTGDKDLMQLVGPNVIIYNPKQGGDSSERLDAQGVQEKVGLPPEKIVDLLALMGDTSDNIPGVPGIGPKTALTLLQEFGSLEKVLQNANQVGNKRARESLQQNTEMALLSYKLATIHCDVPLELGPTDLIVREVDDEHAVAFFQEVEISSLVERFAKRQAKRNQSYHLVDTEEALRQLAADLEKAGSFALDTETTDADPMLAELVGFSFSWQETVAYYIPVKAPSDLATQSRTLDVQLVLKTLRPILENPQIKKCGHNAKYDLLVLSQYGLEVQGLESDTMVASYLLNPSLRQHNLDSVSMEYLKFKKIPTSDLIGSGKNQITMDRVPVEKIMEYACEDAEVTWRLRNHFAPKLQEFDLQELFTKVEIPLVEVLMRIEQNGVALDEIYLAGMSQELDREMMQLEAQIYKIAGGKFNINSTKQLGTVLFEKLKLPTARRTKTGFSTDVAVLEELAPKHEMPRLILDYRQLAKLKSTYVDALPRLINPKTGRVHTSFNQTVAATGRLSSSDPNLQNIPIRTEIGRRIRRAFVTADRQHVILDADYSQIELRVMAHLANDETLRASFLNNEDVHTRTAALVFKTEPNEVTPDQRRKAKEVNFGIMYGMSAYGLSSRLGISPEEGEAFIQTYFAGYPGVQDFIQRTIREAREKGYVTTLLNRRRYLPEINNDNRNIREFAERTAINTPIQGSAADLIKVAMINIHRRLASEKLKSKMILQVHDELVFEVPKDELETMKALVRSEMENAIHLDVPIHVDMGVGDNWLDAH
jgi:DNA polymerase-1